MSTARENFELAQQRYAATFERHLDNGVNFISDNVCIEPEVVIAPGATILPGCILRGQTVIGPDCVIGPNTLLEDTVVDAGSTINASQCYGSHIGPNNKIGPFTHVRVGTKTAEGCHLGAYVETKNADFAEGNTVSHLTYIGDATVGKYCNFGCGTVTCNYDGEGPSATMRSSAATRTWSHPSPSATMRSRLPAPPSAMTCPPVRLASSAPSRPRSTAGASASWRSISPRSRSWKRRRKGSKALQGAASSTPRGLPISSRLSYAAGPGMPGPYGTSRFFKGYIYVRNDLRGGLADCRTGQPRTEI